jgi:hypothetical protein
MQWHQVESTFKIESLSDLTMVKNFTLHALNVGNKVIIFYLKAFRCERHIEQLNVNEIIKMTGSLCKSRIGAP